MKKIMMLLAATLLLPLISAAAQEQLPAQRDDIIAADVRDVIGENVHYTVYDLVDVNVSNGTVILSGYATEPFKIERFKQDIKHTLGLTDIENNVEILPVNQGDSRLRYMIARKIYGDSSLLRYRLSKWPYPIHIIVKHGRVTLVGQVGTKLDYKLIESRVRNTFGVLKVTNKLEIV